MCNFFSVISDGKGKTLFFRAEDVAKEMSEGNKKSYDFSSHTSIAYFFGLSPQQEDTHNKWEYDIDKRALTVDSLNTDDDRSLVQQKIENYLEGKDIGYLKNLYNCNSGSSNSGDYNLGSCNSGSCNSGSCNSGSCNSGSSNSGSSNSGDYNSGNHNLGNYNSGYCNSGDYNLGNCNSGEYNSGSSNSGSCNSGSSNSGDYNSGDRNSGNCNSGTVTGSFCTEKKYFLFDKTCSEQEFATSKIYFDFSVSKFIYEKNMTEEEKKDNPTYLTIGGYLKKLDYKEAWKTVPQAKLDKIKGLKNYDPAVFKSISGLDLE
jgi:hypothetical protein